MLTFSAMRMGPGPLVVLAGGLLGATAARADVINDAHLGFTLALPPGFGDYPPGKTQPGTVYSFIKGTPGTDDFAIVTVQPMGGTIGREPLDPKGLPRADGIELSLRRGRWKSFDIDVIDSVAHQGGTAVFAQVAQVPLEREAIQLAVVGPLERRAELTALLPTLLAALDGPSSWLTTEERSFRLGKAAAYLLAVVVVVLVVWRGSRRKRLPTPSS
jgi:hypothetical protein